MLSADILRDFVVQRRWFRAKARTVSGAEIRDAIAISGTDSTVILLDIQFEEGDADTYLLAISSDQNQEGAAPDNAVVGRDSGKIVYDALWNPKFTSALLDAIAKEQAFDGQHGRLTACHLQAFDGIRCGNGEDLPAKVSKAEQSNSAVFYGDRFILKLFRKLETGINPDFEIGRFLTEHGFKHTPAVAGHLEYKTDSGAMSVGILQQFVPNRGDAWEYTLEQAGGFFKRAFGAGREPQLPSTQHPLELLSVDPPSEAAELIGAYLEAARLLGERTAEMHIALASGNGGSDFAPEPFTKQFREELYHALLAQADRTMSLVRAKQSELTGVAVDDARQLLQIEPRIRAAFGQIRDTDLHAVRIRHHGDYHLGQVLYTGDDFLIIDFEGEPARSLEERRRKHAAMRDVTGMIRSFQYAAYSALVKCEESPSEAGSGWAAFWTAWVSRAFLKSYFAVASGHPFVPADERERRLLFDMLILEKALYEVAYELNNRPDWVGIPLRGIASVIA